MQLLAFIATSFHQLSYLYIFQIHLCGLSGRLQTQLVEPIAQQAQHNQPMAAYVERLRFWICGKHMQCQYTHEQSTMLYQNFLVLLPMVPDQLLHRYLVVKLKPGLVCHAWPI